MGLIHIVKLLWRGL